MAEFLHEWWEILSSPFKTWGWDLAKAIFRLIGFGGLVALTILFGNPIPLWLLVILVVITLYLGSTAGIAWERSRGPIIWVRLLPPDEGYRIFEIRVENHGSGEVIPHVYAVDVHRNGIEVPRIDNQIELHCRGLVRGESGSLFGGKYLKFAMLNVHEGQPPWLNLVVPHPTGGFLVIPLSPSEPSIQLDLQPEWWLTIRVDFHDRDGKILKDKKARFAINPDAGSAICYRVRPMEIN